MTRACDRLLEQTVALVLHRFSTIVHDRFSTPRRSHDRATAVVVVLVAILIIVAAVQHRARVQLEFDLGTAL